MIRLLRQYLLYLALAVGIGACDSDQAKVDVAPDGFVLIQGGQYGATVVDDFEIMDHTVTNAEYKKFTDATGYTVPLHWENGNIPAGKEDYPVIFVNREDMRAYCKWLEDRTNRIYRIPTLPEFMWAACKGDTSLIYYWGNKDITPDREKVNYNYDGQRKYDEWKRYLKPARWGWKNKNGLYNLAGNVWQMVEDFRDPSTIRFKYRINDLVSINNTVIGGGWYTDKGFLKAGKSSFNSPGLRLPDLGFRLVREPEGKDWKVKSRQITAVTNGDGKIVLSWASLSRDTRTMRFNVYRLEGVKRDHKGTKVNSIPVKYTSYLDKSDLMAGKLYQYRVVEVDNDGNEQNPSEWTGIQYSKKLNPFIVKFKPLYKKGNIKLVFGNLEGWGQKGCVVRLDNGNVEMSQDTGIPVQLEAFSGTGRSLWRKDIAWHGNIYSNGNNAPFNVWDMDGDGKDEVITFLQIGEQNYVAILEGISGRVLYKTPWTEMATDHCKSSTRVQMSIAYLDGKNPSVITQTGLYENEIIDAYDNHLNKIWQYKSFGETSGSGSHKIEIADLDGDGKQEVVYGSTCLNHDGTFRWSIYCQHPDMVSIHDFMPDRPGLEIFFMVETPIHAGVYMVDASSGKIIWKYNHEDDPLFSHGHHGWTSDIIAGIPGIECVFNRMGHKDRNLLLFSANGEHIRDSIPFGFMPIEWDGDGVREMLSPRGDKLGKFDNEGSFHLIEGVTPNPFPNSSVLFATNLYGDFRSELVIEGTDTDGKKMIGVISATEPIEKSFVSPLEDKEYRLWLARNMGGGYGSIYEPEYKPTGE